MSLSVKSVFEHIKGVGAWRGFLLGLAFILAPGLGAAEMTFPVLAAGSQTYSNVTVTSRTPRYIIIAHAQGITSIKLKELSSDILSQLGYKVEAAAAQSQSPKPFSPPKLALDPKIKEMQEKTVEEIKDRVRQLSPLMIKGILAGLVVGFLFFSYCSMLICKKVGQEPGGLVWVPILQLIPLLKAAGMSAWWILAWLFVPFASIVLSIVWSVKICQARAKSAWLALLLLLPVTNLFTFLYLAFADNLAEDETSKKITFN